MPDFLMEWEKGAVVENIPETKRCGQNVKVCVHYSTIGVEKR